MEIGFFHFTGSFYIGLLGVLTCILYAGIFYYLLIDLFIDLFILSVSWLGFWLLLYTVIIRQQQRLLPALRWEEFDKIEKTLATRGFPYSVGSKKKRLGMAASVKTDQ